VVIPKGFPYSAISMACFRSDCPRITFIAESRVRDRNRFSEMPGYFAICLVWCAHSSCSLIARRETTNPCASLEFP
jgi:hypothetical protein